MAHTKRDRKEIMPPEKLGILGIVSGIIISITLKP